MRAREFIREFTINVPVTVNIPMSDLVLSKDGEHSIGGQAGGRTQGQSSNDAQTTVVNPGVRYGDDQSAKWSPPLQQHLDTMKDGVGVTMNDVIEEPSQTELANALAIQPRNDAKTKRNKLMPLFVSRPSQPG